MDTGQSYGSDRSAALRLDNRISGRSALGQRSFSLLMHRGRVGDADDRTLAGLQSSDGLSPRLGTCVVEQREALLLQLGRCDLDGLRVRDLELDARLWHRPLHWPVRRAEARLRSLSQGPDPEGLATVDVFPGQVTVTFCGQRQAKPVHLQPSADARVRRDGCDLVDDLQF